MTVIVSAGKTPNNNVFVCKSRYVGCLLNELCIDNSLGKLYIYPDDNCERGNPGHSHACF